MLFEPGSLGDIAIRNRIVMAPMTRSRADIGDIPGPLTVEYYRQRASAGLIVAEGTQPSAAGKGYCRTPGMYSPAQIAAWRAVADAVHAEGGRIVVQLMHCGRVAARINKGDSSEVVAPSAIRAGGTIFTDVSGLVEMDMPRALETNEIPAVVEEYAQAARNAVAAGLDGVEIHCASGYLPMQFLSTGSNHRTDRYGGNVTNRIRFVVEILEATSAATGSGRVGFRICPGFPLNDVQDDDPTETYGALLAAAVPLDLAYLHLIHVPFPQIDGLDVVKARWRGATILNNEMNRRSAEDALQSGIATAISFGRDFIANPDLVERLRIDAPLANFDPALLYSPGPQGYVDYPAMEGVTHV